MKITILLKMAMIIIIFMSPFKKTAAQVAGTPYIVPHCNVCKGATTMGTDFYITFPSIVLQQDNVFEQIRFVAQDKPATVTLTAAFDGWKTYSSTNSQSIGTYTFNVPAHSLLTVDLNNVDGAGRSIIPGSTSNISGNSVAGIFTMADGLHITSTEDIALYAFISAPPTNSLGNDTGNPFGTGADATTVFPVSAWGNSYRRLSYTPRQVNGTFNDYDMIMSSQPSAAYSYYVGNGTTPPVQTRVIQDHNSGTNQINSVASFFATAQDRTGLPITGFALNGDGTDGSPVPIAHFSGTSLAAVPNPAAASSTFPKIYPIGGFISSHNSLVSGMLFDQSIAISQWGTKYLVPNIPQAIDPTFASAGLPNYTTNRIRIVASEDNTDITVSGAIPRATSIDTTVNPFTGNLPTAGSWVEYSIDADASLVGAVSINATKPVGVGAYMASTYHNATNYSTTIKTFSDKIGASSMTSMPSLNQMVTKATVAPFIQDPARDGMIDKTYFDDSTRAEHMMMIIARTGTKGSTIVDDNAGNITTLNISSNWVDDAASGYSYYRWKFNNVKDFGKAFTVTNSCGVIILMSGQAPGQSYYYIGASCAGTN